MVSMVYTKYGEGRGSIIAYFTFIKRKKTGPPSVWVMCACEDEEGRITVVKKLQQSGLGEGPHWLFLFTKSWWPGILVKDIGGM